MRKQYIEEFYLRVQTNLFERALKESGIGFTREDDVISEETQMFCDRITYFISGKDVIDIYEKRKALLKLAVAYNEEANIV